METITTDLHYNKADNTKLSLQTGKGGAGVGRVFAHLGPSWGQPEIPLTTKVVSDCRGRSKPPNTGSKNNNKTNRKGKNPHC